ncbi:SlyX family protein [Psychrobacter sp. I-STPA10]|uniref:SlyX family protein n=1 Tax=Psychrobacter sp. I-STPA10 TaxID=2585769 RepID=UPI001E39B757|nr:SlyX family protein [Psychrobacter sp. I-STPA10]
MTDYMNEQLIALQTAVAHLEDNVDRLDKVIAKQDQQLQNMQRQLQLMYAHLDNKSEQGIAPFDLLADRPPHY